MGVFDRIRQARVQRQSREAYEKRYPVEALKELREERKSVEAYNKLEGEKKKIASLRREQNTPAVFKTARDYLAKQKAKRVKIGMGKSSGYGVFGETQVNHSTEEPEPENKSPFNSKNFKW